MKVLIDGRVLKQDVLTGVQRYTRELLTAFDNEGFLYDVLMPKSTNRYYQHYWEQTILPRESRKYDVLFCPGNVAPFWKPAGTKLITVLHSMAYYYCPDSYGRFFRTYYRLAIPRVVRLSDRVVTVSDSERAVLIKHFSGIGQKTVAIQNGIDKVFKQAVVSPAKEPYILYVGSLNPLKNYKRVIEAFNLIQKDIPHKLLIVGPKPPIFQGERPGNTDRIELVGEVRDDGRLAELYSRAALFVFPSLYEASPLPPIEAMACGCPVLISDIPALVERCGDAALRVNPCSVQAIAEGMKGILTNTRLRGELIHQGLERAKLFSWKRTAQQTIGVIREAAGLPENNH